MQAMKDWHKSRSRLFIKSQRNLPGREIYLREHLAAHRAGGISFRHHPAFLIAFNNLPPENAATTFGALATFARHSGTRQHATFNRQTSERLALGSGTHMLRGAI
jgi:hypothetical protein